MSTVNPTDSSVGAFITNAASQAASIAEEGCKAISPAISSVRSFFTDSSVGKFITNTALQTASVTVAGMLRRTCLPTPSLIAFALVQSVVTNTLSEGVKWIAHKIGFNPENDHIFETGVYVISQAASIGITCLLVNNVAIAILGAPILYDMVAVAIRFDMGAIYCIVAQSTLVTLTVKAAKDFFNEIGEWWNRPQAPSA